METGGARAGRSSRNRVKRVARLRRWLLGGVVLLLVVLAGLMGYARYRAHRFLADIPRRLGIDVKSETNGFTLSKSIKGHTLFTVHAAKAIQRENGKTTLHDVAITLYGPQGSNRTDSIRGDAFEYDQPNGVVRATGEVHLDLAAPASDGAATKSNTKRIAVTTRGLVFLQKLGVAATDEPIQILYGDMHGGASGADYESDTGVLRLRKDVRLDGLEGGSPVHVEAAAAELDRTTQVATLHMAHVTTRDGSSSGDRMLFALAKQGGIQSIDAEGNVALQGSGGSHAEAPRLRARISDQGKLQAVTMTGGVRLQDAANTATATDAQMRFDTAGKPEQVDLQHAVRIDTPASAGQAHSTLSAGRVIALLVVNGRRTEMRDAVASGGAELRTVEAFSEPEATRQPAISAGKEATVRTTVLTAQTLHAVTGMAEGVRYITALDGAGGTRIDESDNLGNTRSSSGDTLQATLLPRGKGTQKQASGALRTAVQTGHVTIAQHAVVAGMAAGQARGSRGEPQNSRAAAQRAEFDATTGRLILTGTPVVTAPGLQLAADRIVLLQATGAAEAQGTVKATLMQEKPDGKGEPVHVIAGSANMAGAGGPARFFGGDKAVRMWTSTAQLQAPELELDRAKGTLAAHSPAGGKSLVQLMLPSPGMGEAPATGTRKAASSSDRGTVQVTGREMLMVGATAQEPGHIDFTDEVRVFSAGSDLRARHVVAALKRASRTEGTQVRSAAGALNGGSIESILATGDVRLRQPGRTGTGEQLLYTEADGRYRLTGTQADPPSITDSLRGTVTGTTLIFRGGDDSVEVTGEAGHRVHTETQAARPSRSR